MFGEAQKLTELEQAGEAMRDGKSSTLTSQVGASDHNGCGRSLPLPL